MRVAALTVALLSSVALVSPAQATFPGGNGLIAYYDYASSPEQIFAVEPDGSPVTQLTHGDRGSRDPHWSADGTTLALVKDPIASGRDRLATMNADGSNVTILLSGVGQRRKTIYNPTFSPDGTQIAFCAFGSAPSAIYLINTDGSGLTKISRRHHADCNPTWSPDGATIAFVTFPSGRTSAIGTMSTDGSNRKLLVAHGTNDNPDWSPDGSQIVFSRFPGTQFSRRFDIYTIGVDGTGRTRLTDTPQRWEFTPSFSPDGTAIAFSRGQASAVDSPGDIFTMWLDGSNVTRVTDTPEVDEFWLSWQPV